MRCNCQNHKNHKLQYNGKSSEGRQFHRFYCKAARVYVERSGKASDELK